LPDQTGYGFGKHTSDPARWQRASPLEGFVYRYMAHHMKYPTPDYHREFYWAVEDSDRLLEISPRGFGKSFRASFFLPLAFAAMERVQRIALISKTAGLAEYFLGLIKQEVASNKLLRNDFPSLRRGPRWANDELQFTNGVQIIAKGFGAQIRGFHPQLIVIDDPEDEESAASEIQRDKIYDIFLRTIMGALQDHEGEKALMAVIGTNIHPDCLVNKIYTNYEGRYPDWSILFFSALDREGKSIWEDAYSTQWLEKRRREIGSMAFKSEYMNEPILGEAILFYPDYFRTRYELEPLKQLLDIPHRDKVVVGAVDIAQSLRESADSSAWVIAAKQFSQNRKYVLSGQVVKLPMRHLARQVALECERYDVDYLYIEDPLKESTDPERQSIVPQVFREEFHGAGVRTIIRTVRPDRDKYRRAMPVQAMAERREIWFPKELSPGLRRVFDQIIRFPLAAHEDGLDAFVYCMRMLDKVGQRHDTPDFISMGDNYALRG